MAVDSQRGLDVAVPEHRGDRLHVNTTGDEPTRQTVTQIVPAPPFDRLPAQVKVTDADEFPLPVPLFNGIEDFRFDRCRV